MNQCQLLGRMTFEPKLNKTNKGKSYLNFTLAVKGFNRTDFVPCQAWDKNAELIYQYCKKGQYFGVVGSIQVNEYTNNQGVKVKDVRCNVVQVVFTENNKRKEEDVHTTSYGVEFTDKSQSLVEEDTFSTLELDSDALPF